jgi:hypothetical protein
VERVRMAGGGAITGLRIDSNMRKRVFQEGQNNHRQKMFMIILIEDT